MKESSHLKTDTTSNQMYIVDLSRILTDADTLDDVLHETRGLWDELYSRLEDDEVLWVIAPNDYRDGRMWPVAMAVADFARQHSDLVLKNTITLHRWDDRGADMESTYDDILFFVKNKSQYQFHKDRIRVEHVYEGNEWGGERKEGNSAYHDTKVRRYNPDGKDPGNVWLDEDRSQTSDQSVNESRPIPLTEAIRRCVLVGSSEGETVYTLHCDDAVGNAIEEEGRKAKSLDATTLQMEVSGQ